jgi:two-component system LytT family response regulator
VGERIVLIRVDDVSWFEADAKLVRLHGLDAAGKPAAFPMRQTMLALERRLDPERFVRVSRSAIVNLDHVRHAEPWSHGEYVLVLRTGDRVVTTHGYRAAVQRVLRDP